MKVRSLSRPTKQMLISGCKLIGSAKNVLPITINENLTEATIHREEEASEIRIDDSSICFISSGCMYE